VAVPIIGRAESMGAGSAARPTPDAIKSEQALIAAKYVTLPNARE
jgi:hypothetical protein